MKSHVPGNWKITVEATDEKEGKRTQSCTVCGKVLSSENYSLTAAEAEAYYKRSCQRIEFSKLERSPGTYEGTRVVFSGRVLQVCSEASSIMYYSTYRLGLNGGYYDVVYLLIDNYGSGERILEDDWLTVYGEFDGLYTYESVSGASITIPKIKVEYYD